MCNRISIIMLNHIKFKAIKMWRCGVVRLNVNHESTYIRSQVEHVEALPFIVNSWNLTSCSLEKCQTILYNWLYFFFLLEQDLMEHYTMSQTTHNSNELTRAATTIVNNNNRLTWDKVANQCLLDNERRLLPITAGFGEVKTACICSRKKCSWSRICIYLAY